MMYSGVTSNSAASRGICSDGTAVSPDSHLRTVRSPTLQPAATTVWFQPRASRSSANRLPEGPDMNKRLEQRT